MEGKRNYESAKSDNLRLVVTSPMIEMIALCREKQSTVKSGHETDPDNTDNDEEDQTPEVKNDTDSYQSDDSIKEAGLYVTSIANLRRREMHGISGYE